MEFILALGLKNLLKKLVFRYNKFFKNGINLQLYHEYFVEKHSYDDYTEK